MDFLNPRNVSVCGCKRKAAFPSPGDRASLAYLLSSVMAICFWMAIPEYASARTTAIQDQQSQAGQTGQSTGTQQPPPLKPPGTPPQITNMGPAQENQDQRAPQNKNQIGQLLPSEPDTEFQAFIKNSLKVKLPIFGQNLFENVPSTFAPLDRVQVPTDYIIGPDDELLVRAWGQIDVNWRAVVDRSGAIYIPQIGNFNVAGVKYGDLHDYLQSQMGRIFKNFQLSVSMGRLRSMQVFVVGEVRRPGTYTISSLVTMVDALFASNGPSKHGSMRMIQLKRDGKTITTLDLYDLIVFGDKSKDAKLQPGDVIYVPPAGPLVALAGSVNNQAIFELKDHTTLKEVLEYAGGMTNTAAGDFAVVERIDEHQFRKSEEFPLDPEGLGRELRDGDVVRFLHISPRFEDTITLRGNVAVPGRYPWHAGMRVRDLIPNRNFLITDEYWNRQNQLDSNARIQNSAAGNGQIQSIDPITGRVQTIDPGTGEVQIIDPQKDQIQVIDPKTGQIQNRDARVSQEREQSVRVDQTQLKNDVKRPSAEINWNYAVVQRFDLQDLTTHLLPFNLGKAIEGDAEQNPLLQPGDIVTIFSQVDIKIPIGEQTKFVQVEGEVPRAGVYEVQAGETLHHLLTRIGGLSPQAYVFGAEFTRESARIEQQKRLDQYIDEQEQAINRSTAAIASVGDPTQVAAAKETLVGQRALIEKMKTIRATGRIVLEVRPSATTLTALPDLVLEDNDRLVVPFKPATIDVIGSVYNSASFVYKPGKTVADYVRLAGGTRKDGDKSREYVIRADGSTIGRQQQHASTSRSFDSLRLMPGDSIVVPQKVDPGAFIRGLKDWTQILGPLLISAAAVKTLIP
jgi:polysaccharide export outer membrane protein